MSEAKMPVVAKKKYQFPSAPCSFSMPDGRRITVMDGVYETSNAEEIAELDKAVEVGNIYRFVPAVPKTPAQIPPPPVGADKIN